MESLLLFFNLGGQELIIILVMVLLLFGGRKIPELMKGLGRGIREFNSARADIEHDFKESIREPEEREIKEKRKLTQERTSLED